MIFFRFWFIEQSRKKRHSRRSACISMQTERKRHTVCISKRAGMSLAVGAQNRKCIKIGSFNEICLFAQ